MPFFQRRQLAAQCLVDPFQPHMNLVVAEPAVEQFMQLFFALPRLLAVGNRVEGHPFGSQQLQIVLDHL
ncbi:hypothetical protein D3C86_2234220 [compost metagenome]